MTSPTAGAHPSATATASTPLLRVEGVSKRFGEVAAATGINLEVRAGEVHAVVGENGAGKSTLLKMIYGVYTPDSGRMSVGGREVVSASPAESRALGIGMVFRTCASFPR